jgi:hypothetical protein
MYDFRLQEGLYRGDRPWNVGWEHCPRSLGWIQSGHGRANGGRVGGRQRGDVTPEAGVTGGEESGDAALLALKAEDRTKAEECRASRGWE